MAALQLAEVLYTQGFGTRRVCAGLVQSGQVAFRNAGEPWRQTLDSSTLLERPEESCLRVLGVEWPVHAKAYLMLHKPAGIECSQKPSAYPSVYTLLPAPLRQRPVKGGQTGVQAIGRLDQDTTGLLLLSDDGQFIHRMGSPKHRVAKVYEVQCRHAVTDSQIRQLLDGVVLHDAREAPAGRTAPTTRAAPERVHADECMQHGDKQLSLVLHAGKYHQVKRMLAAVGNRVEQLHRSRIGALELPEDLLPGQWRWLSAEQLAQLKG